MKDEKQNYVNLSVKFIMIYILYLPSEILF